MYRYILFVLLTVSAIANVSADKLKITGIVLDAQNKTSLPGANIIIANTTTGTVTDKNGLFEINTTNKNETVIVSFVGYKADTILVSMEMNNEILLSPELKLNEFTLAERKSGTHLSRKSATHSEHLSSAELGKAACCSLSESFETNATVDISHTDAVSGAKQIKMLGLAGKYVQITTEKLPSIRGALSRFGLDYIPGPWMESISISKGTSSVVDGYESLTGQINIELKRPEDTKPLFINAYASAEGRYETNIIAAKQFSENLSTVLLTHTSYNNTSIDNNGDNFLDMPLIKRYEITNKWQYRKNKYVSHYAIHWVNENRESGNKLWFNNKSNANAYGIENKTSRLGFDFKQAYITNPLKDASVAIIITGSTTTGDSKYGLNTFNVDEKYLFANLIYHTKLINAKNSISAGLNGTFKDLKEQSSYFNYKANENTGGLFAEYSYVPSHKLVLQVGLRSDYSSMHNSFFITPRAHIKYELIEDLHLRASAGKGFRTASILTENSAFFASSRKIILQETAKMEESLNYGGSIVWYIKSFLKSSFIIDFYRTDFMNKIITDLDRTPSSVLIYNQANSAYSDAFQAEYNFEPIKNLTTKIAFRYNNVKFLYDGKLRETPLNSKFKSLITTSYVTSNRSWQFDVTAKHTGGGRLPDPGLLNPMWDKTYGDYYTFNAQITKYFKNWEVYLGSENISNYTISNPIINSASPNGDGFDASLIWGPILGRTAYLGLRLTIN